MTLIRKTIIYWKGIKIHFSILSRTLWGFVTHLLHPLPTSPPTRTLPPSTFSLVHYYVIFKNGLRKTLKTWGFTGGCIFFVSFSWSVSAKTRKNCLHLCDRSARWYVVERSTNQVSTWSDAALVWKIARSIEQLPNNIAHSGHDMKICNDFKSDTTKINVVSKDTSLFAIGTKFRTILNIFFDVPETLMLGNNFQFHWYRSAMSAVFE